MRFEAEYKEFMTGPQATPFAIRFPDNRTLIIRDHSYPLDDTYCFVNGWYDLPRAELVSNFSYLEEVSDRYCDHLSKTVPGYWNISMADLFKESKADEAFLYDIQKNGADVGYATPSFVDGMILHAAAKCVLRGPLPLWVVLCYLHLVEYILAIAGCQVDGLCTWIPVFTHIYTIFRSH